MTARMDLAISVFNSITMLQRTVPAIDTSEVKINGKMLITANNSQTIMLTMRFVKSVAVKINVKYMIKSLNVLLGLLIT